MGTAARKKMERVFGIQQQVAKIEEMYDQVLAQSRQ
jgi:hypothetical protein